MTLIAINAAIWVLILATGGSGSAGSTGSRCDPRALCVVRATAASTSRHARVLGQRRHLAAGRQRRRHVAAGHQHVHPRRAAATSASTWWRCGSSGRSWS